MYIEDSESALEAYGAALDTRALSILFCRTIQMQYKRIQQSSFQASAVTLASAAAALALEENKPELAVELLDQGSTAVFSQLARYRIVLDDLCSSADPRAKALADRFVQIGQELDKSTLSGTLAERAAPDFESSVTRSVPFVSTCGLFQ